MFSSSCVSCYIWFSIGFISLFSYYLIPKVFFKSRCRKFFKNKVVLITGASSGLGKELARLFFIHGAKVLLASRRSNELEKLKQELLEENKFLDQVNPNEPVVIVIDLSDPDKVHQIASEKIFNDHRIDILINNAGLTSRASVAETILRVDQNIMNINYFGQVALTKAVLKSMIANQLPGHIMGVSSIQGRFAIPFRSSYSASKHALQAFYDCLRAEMQASKQPIEISVISPGYIRTNMSVNALNSDGSNYGRMDPTTDSGYEPEFVAWKCLEMIINKEPELVLTPLTPRIMLLIRALCPKLFFFLIGKYGSQKQQ